MLEKHARRDASVAWFGSVKCVRYTDFTMVGIIVFFLLNWSV